MSYTYGDFTGMFSEEIRISPNVAEDFLFEMVDYNEEVDVFMNPGEVLKMVTYLVGQLNKEYGMDLTLTQEQDLTLTQEQERKTFKSYISPDDTIEVTTCGAHSTGVKRDAVLLNCTEGQFDKETCFIFLSPAEALALAAFIAKQAAKLLDQ